MSFTLDAAQELGIPEILFWTTSACGFMGYLHYLQLIKKGLTPFTDESYLTNGYLDTVIDWIPGMKDIRLRDLPSFIRTTDPEDVMLDFFQSETERCQKASAIILNTFDALEHDVLIALSTLLPPVYSIGPLHLLLNNVKDKDLKLIESNLWTEDSECLEWLDSKGPNSVVYVNFGSITVMTTEQLVEFAWGLANSNITFFWVIRPDLVAGDNAILPPEFVTVTKERGICSSYCAQEKVLSRPSIGGFLTHSGWNSTLESISAGVPLLCWPFFAEQQTNCRYSCKEWGIGMEINSDVKRDEVERLVIELMEGEKGKEMKKAALEWKKMAEEATASLEGSSFQNFEKVIKAHLSSSRDQR
uniref:Anthocyanidin 3-O-glucosyltransferase n=1 Tax=Manihot esculenta TaxID=3983 RepID=A0A2C9U160_MANES